MDYDPLVQSLSPRAKRALRLMACGQTQGQAAAQCAFSSSRMSVIANSTLGKDYLAMVETDVNAALVEENATVELDTKKQALALIAEELPNTVNTLLFHRDSSPPAVSFAAAKHLGELGGLVVKEQVAVESRILADPGVLEALQRLTKVPSVPQVPLEAPTLPIPSQALPEGAGA